MSPRTGRPTENPKKNRLEIRLSDVENSLLEKKSQELNATKTELLMEGYAMSQLITGEELKERLIKQYHDLMQRNNDLNNMIQDMPNHPMTSKESIANIQHYKECIKENEWLCKVVKKQLKRDFDYEI